jgi:hypothetical protein
MNRLLRFSLTFSVLFVLVALESMLVKPFVVFSMYLHQIGHFLSAISFSFAPGTDFLVNFTDVSYTIIRPRGFISSFIIASSGYIANLGVAILILQLMKTPISKYLLGGTSFVYLAITLAYNGTPEHLKNLAVFMAFVIMIYMIQSEDFHDLAIRILAFSNILYVLYDTGINSIYSRVAGFIGLPGSKNDIVFTDDTSKYYQLTGIDPIVWGILWFGLTIFVLVTIYQTYISEESEAEDSEQKAA